MTQPDVSDLLDRIADHCRFRGYRFIVLDSEGIDAHVSVRLGPGSNPVTVMTDGVVSRLIFPGGYSWTEFSYEEEDLTVALGDLFKFLDAYMDSATHEMSVRRRWLPGRRRELRVSNGAILRVRGFSKGPDDSGTEVSGS